MSISKFNPAALSVSFDDDSMWVDLTDGRKLGVPLTYFPRLQGASAEQRAKYVISGGGVGIHWDDLDEDLSVKGLLMGVRDPSSQTVEAA